jgi:hypothetical protein
VNGYVSASFVAEWPLQILSQSLLQKAELADDRCQIAALNQVLRLRKI